MMIKKIAGTIAAIAAAAMMTTTAFAGEWVTLNDGRKYYNTGYDDGYEEGYEKGYLDALEEYGIENK